MKIFCAGIVTETNGFVTRPTTLADFAGALGGVLRHTCPESTLSFASPTWERLCEKRGHEFIVGVLAGAMPGGPTERDAYESMRNALVDGLTEAGPVDAVLLDLHGAMMADGYPDVEGDVIERVRDTVGPDVPIGVHLDLHCHLSDKMVRNATVIVTMKEWPHTDVPERATEVLNAIEATALGNVAPLMSVHDCRMVGCYPTYSSPMKEFVGGLACSEQEQHVISVSLVHGFPYADNPDVGAKVLVVTDDAPAVGKTLAREIGERFWAIREDAVVTGHIDTEQAIQLARAPDRRPLVLCDQADSVAGGAAGDATFLLRAILDAGIENVVFGPLWDPRAVAACRDAGVGAERTLTIGGKTGPESGDSVTLTVTVRNYVPELVQDAVGEIPAMRFGEAVWLSADKDIDIVVHTERAATILPGVIENTGIDLTRKAVVVAKMWRHGEAGFAKVAGSTRVVSTPGAQPLDFSSIEYATVRHPLWPHEPAPFGRGPADTNKTEGLTDQ